MALIEIDDAELQKLRAELAQARPSKALLDKLGQNPKTRVKAFALLKEAQPDLVIPEYDAAKPLMDEISALHKRLDEKDKKDAETQTEQEKKRLLADAEERMGKGRKWLKERGYQDEGVKKIEDLMEKRGIPDYEAATAFFEQQNPPEDPVIPMRDFNTASNLFAPPEDNPWKEAVKAPHPRVADKLVRMAQAKEVQGFFKDLGREKAAARR